MSIQQHNHQHQKCFIHNIDMHLLYAMLLAPLCWFSLSFVYPSSLHVIWPWQQLSTFLMLVLIYPIFEEIVFRGALQGWLRNKTWGKFHCFHLSYANFITSLLFSVLHLYSHTPLAAAAVFLPSLVFGYFRDRYNQQTLYLLTPIALHAYYNAGWFCLFSRTTLPT